MHAHATLLLLLLFICHVAFAIPERYLVGGIYVSQFEQSGIVFTCCLQDPTAARIAFEKVNKDKILLPNGPIIDFEYVDDNYSPAIGLQKLFEFKNKGVQIITGQPTSLVTSTTAYAGTVYGISQISYAASSAELSNRARYKYFSRVVANDNQQAAAVLQVIGKIGDMTNNREWRRLAVISTSESYGVGLAKTLINLAPQEDVEILTYQSYLATTTNVDIEIQELKKSGARVFAGLIISAGWAVVLRTAVKEEIIGEYHIWLCTDGCSGSSSYFTDDGTAPDPAKLQAMRGMLGTQAFTRDSGPTYEAFVEDWLQRDPVEYPGAGTMSTIDFNSRKSYDTGLFVATVLSQIVRDGHMDDNGYIDPDIYKEYLSNTTIDGAASPVVLTNQELYGIYSIVNLQPDHPNNLWASVGFWNDTNGFTLEKDIIWFDNTTNIPDIDIRPAFNYWSCHDGEKKRDKTGKTVKLHTPDGDDVDTIKYDYHCDYFIDCQNMSDESIDCATNYTGLFIGFGIFTGLLILMVFATIIVTILFTFCFPRRRLRAASPLFLLILCISVIVGLSSTYAWYGKPHPVACGFQPWLLGLPVVSMVSAICSKNFRIWRIFRAPWKKQAIHNLEVFIYWVILVVPALIILIVWTIVSTPTAEMEYRIDDDHYLCSTGGFTGSPGGWIFFGIFVGYSGAILAFGAFLSIATRNVPALFNESKLLAVSIYNLIFLSAIIIPTYIVLLDINPFAAWIVRTCAIIYAFAVTFIIQYAPIIAGMIFLDRCRDLDNRGVRKNMYNQKSSSGTDRTSTGTM